MTVKGVYTEQGETNEETLVLSNGGGGLFYIKNMYSGKYLDVDNGRDANGTSVIQWDFTGATNQVWRVVHVGNGEYKLFPVL